jgi:hypothetical protein
MRQLEASSRAKALPLREKLLGERLAALPQSVRDDLKAVASTDENKRSDVQKYLAEKFQETLKITNEDLIRRFPDYKLEVENAKKSMDELKKKLQAKPQIRALFDMGGEPSAGLSAAPRQCPDPGRLGTTRRPVGLESWPYPLQGRHTRVEP